MKILGIDPGSVCTGWGVIDYVKHSYTLLSFGTISPKNGLLSQKYVTIFDEVEGVIEKYQPDCIAVETQFVDKNPKSTLTLSMARIVAVLPGAKRNLPIFEYAPLKAKQAVTGSSKASKEQVQKMIAVLLNTDQNIPFDASDALALAITHAHCARSKASLPF
jgi:crossover junction endodeoxyribonuclease RuvC